MTSNAGNSERLSVLVVEDSMLIADDICQSLTENGCEVVGPAGRVTRALDLIDSAHIDGAMLDINLNGEYSFQVAERLAAEQIPFIFLTGYDDRNIVPATFRDVPVLQKPHGTADLRRAVAKHFSKRDTGLKTLN